MSTTSSAGNEQPKLADELCHWQPIHRLQRLQKWMSGAGLGCLVAVGPKNVTYLTGYARYWGGPAAVVLAPDGTRTLCVMRDEVPVAQELADADRVIGYGQRGFGINLDPYGPLLDVVADLDAVREAAKIAVADESGLGRKLLEERVGRTAVAADAAVDLLRRVKDEDELRKLLWSYQLCWLAQHTVAEHAARGESEIEMFSAAASAAQITNGAPIEFLTDLLSGPNTVKVCCPIHVAGPRRVHPGEAVVADIVVGAHGYFGDSAETHIVGEGAAVSEKRMRLLDILRSSADELRPGVTGDHIFEAMAERIADAFPGGEFPHHAGHAVGLTSFEDPHMIPGDETPLESFMVIALEPGVYGPDESGVRVENLFIVTPNGGVELRAAFGVAP
jgi:Xaa-Pro aminopeptidase